MITEPLDFKKALQLLLRRKLILVAAAVLGLVAGGAWALLRPPMLSSQAWVVLQPSIRGGVGTQVVIARSDAVLTRALADIHPRMSVPALRNKVDVQNRTSTLLIISATGRTAAQAEGTANAVARGYVGYVGHRGNLPDGPLRARIIQPASTATGPDRTPRLVGMGLLGALLGAVLAALLILATGRRDRRLRHRDEIADSIGVPVLASIGVDHPSNAAGWRTLLQEYQPGAVDAWRMRKALQYLGLTDPNQNAREAGGLTLTLVSASVDRKALALGPQLAVFAASRGIPTALVIGPQQDLNATATLRAACTAPNPQPSGHLRVIVKDAEDPKHRPTAALTVVVTVVDSQAPQVTHLTRNAATVLGVSAGAATADQLARAAASAAVGGHDIIGILVADPDPADTTTGRLPQVDRPAHRRRPTRTTSTNTGTSR